MSILERGGNAFDAAVATGFTLQIVEPHLSGPAGDMPAILYSARDRAVRVLCAQGTAPQAATIAKFRELGLAMIPGTGFLAAAVPGAFDGWMLLLREFGTMTIEEVLAPAIGYAERGFPILPRRDNGAAAAGRVLQSRVAEFGGGMAARRSAAGPGTLFATPAVAQTYKRILAEAKAAGGDRERQIEAARNAFYRGFVAEAIDRFATRTPQMDGSGRRNVALLTADDMANWRATLEEPVSYDYGRYRVHKTGPWGQGPVLLQQLALLKGFDLDALAYDGADFVHVVTECSKLAFADREAFYGDPAYSETPLTTLLSDAYNDERRRLISKQASMELRPGLPGISAPRLETMLALARACPTPVGPGGGEPTFARIAGPSRRHGSSRRHRSLGQYDRGDAERRLAPKFAHNPRTRFSVGNASPNVLARRGLAVEPDPRRKAAHNPLANSCRARRRALSRLRLARRRPAGSVDAAAPSAPFSSSIEPARSRSIRRCSTACISPPPSRRAPPGRACSRSRTDLSPRRSMSWRGVVTCSTWLTDGRSVGCAPLRLPAA